MPGFIRLNRDGDDDNRPYTAESYGESVHPGDSPSIPTEASSDGQRPNTPESYGQRVYPPSESANSEYAPSIPTGRGGQMSLPAGYQPGLDGYHQVSSAFSNSSVASSSRPPTGASQGQRSSYGGDSASRPQTSASQRQQSSRGGNTGQHQTSGPTSPTQSHIRADWLAHFPRPPAASPQTGGFYDDNGSYRNFSLFTVNNAPVWHEEVPYGSRRWVVATGDPTSHFTHQ